LFRLQILKLIQDDEKGQFCRSLKNKKKRGNKLRKRLLFRFIITTILCSSVAVSAQVQQVLTGIDVLEAEQFERLINQKVGLITNHTGINRQWKPTIDLIFQAKGVQLIALFSPEHGIRGTVDTWVASSVDSLTGLPVHSLYSSKNYQPADEIFNGIETLVFDIQDIGARFYTYIATMKICMEVAAKNNIKFIVLDRPNPINGLQVEGPVLAHNQLYLLGGIFPMPIRHGMTVGELAIMLNTEEALGVNLKVIKMSNWKRSMWFDNTGLPWVNPSPNMKNLYEAALYPGLGLLERLNVANKRGLWRPFEQFGAPWVNAIELASELNRRKIPGVFFTPIKFIPTDHKYVGQLCEGVAVNLVNRDTFPSVKCGVEVVHALYKLYPDSFEIDKIWHMTRSRELIAQIKQQIPVQMIEDSWQSAINEFSKTRQKYLLY